MSLEQSLKLPDFFFYFYKLAQDNFLGVHKYDQGFEKKKKKSQQCHFPKSILPSTQSLVP